MNPGVDQGIVPIILAPHMLLTTAAKETVADAASCGAWIHRNMHKVNSTDINTITPGGTSNAISIVELSSPVLIGFFSYSSPCGLNVSQEVGNKQQSSSPGLIGQSQKLYAVVDRKLSDYRD